MRFRPASAVAFVFAVYASSAHAQFALNSEGPVTGGSGGGGARTVEASKAPAYKLVHGVVQGENGTLAGATVRLHGSNTLVVTNADGQFELRVPADAQTLQLTCGYGGLQDETVQLTAVQALGSVYLLRAKRASTK